MKKQLIATAVIAACATPLVYAQASNFEGFGIGLGVTSADTTTEYVHGSSLSSTSTDNNAVLQVQYNSAVSDVFVVGVGLTGYASDLKAGKIAGTELKVKDGYSLYVAPGYVFNSNWMGYGKLAYLNAYLKDSSGHGYSFDDGWGYGIGVQTMLDKHWFGQLEYMVNQYTDRSPAPGDTIKLKSNIYSLTAGYRF